MIGAPGEPLGKGGWMSAFVKSIPLADRLIRRNPLYYRGFRRLLQQTERATLQERRAMAERLLQRSRAWAGALPGYGRLDLVRPMAEQPVLMKEALVSRAEDFQATSWLPAAHAATGGTTGVPLQLVRSLPSLTMEQAMIDHLAAKAGIDLPASRVAVLRGDGIKDPNDTRPPFWRQASPQRVVFSSNHLNAANYPAFEAELMRFQPDVLLAYPSSLELLTDLAEERDSAVRFKLVITSSEMLRVGQRARVRRCFGAALIDYYGMAERVSAAYSQEDGQYRFIFPYGFTELLETSPGRYRIVGTALWNKRQPFWRYDTDDIAILPQGASVEQRERVALGIDAFSGIEGRVTDYFLLADGSRIWTLDQVPYGVSGAATVQLMQESLDTAVLIVVPNSKFSDHTLDVLRHNFYLKAPRSIKLRLEVRDSPYRLANGKAPSFISTLTQGLARGTRNAARQSAPV
jgi:phenylacetate-CoA ligase